MKAYTAILKDGKPFYHPEFSNDIHHEIELVLKIGRNGRHIAPEFAHSYISEIGIGIDFTARDLQEKLKNKGLPWELSKAFDFSAVLGDFTPVDQFSDFKNISFGLKKNGEWQQKGNTSLMIFPFDTIISYVSQFFTLKIGDYIFTGTPAGVSKINIGDRLEGFLENASALSCEIR